MNKIVTLAALTLCLASCENTTHRKDAAVSNDIKTPFDHAAEGLDQTLTQKIRQLLMENPSVSIAGKNISVDTKEGVVTLAGPVANETEKLVIEKIVAAVPGVKKVDNQLEIKSA